jgi:hypothetical protein
LLARQNQDFEMIFKCKNCNSNQLFSLYA